MRVLPFAFKSGSTPPPSGAWYATLTDPQITSSVSVTTSVMRNTPITLPAGNVTKLSAYKWSYVAGRNWRIGLYDNARNLLVQDVLTFSATGWADITVSAVAISAGNYIGVINAVTDGDTVGWSSTVGTRALKNGTYNPLPATLPADDGGSVTGAFALRFWVE